ncbi:MAG TPA: 50S ribosomal protein L13 [Elusimicrobia bacterium]|nr:MAG: 50S ribosomal protein L13 [Elusimicrobia bacterium RIFOXYA12_FULL_49_49]OGS14997.1 MAG: 50S ribosomal protein L13 [Elusimicrobia bacterium RIFOXYA2_FULL_47_53]OGS26068.1 MAG: 50S ribosomal protein L13 [Elusimicrobia bacterium RIFOXYB12_FULL_50_12]OGS29341.1 MAG: 50S ribosomal protein L13 [Elusimicrobia bacterium RIFOXYB2_FULL_46_23]HBU70302.1 50S ribosomal protein L13 [Elusimicrobiota bacterium]
MIPKTYLPKQEEIKRGWHLIDASGRPLGRLATQAANILRGKTKRIYTPHLDCGDFVVVTNAEKVVLTGDKLNQKIDYRHSGYSGGDVYTPYSKLMADNPQKAIRLAVKGMLQHNRLGSKQIVRLKVYKGSAHPHSAQFAKSETK